MKNTEHHRMDWNGVELEIIYRRWLNGMALIDVHSPVPLPIAPDGLFRHALNASSVIAAGGPVAYIDVILAAEGGA